MDFRAHNALARNQRRSRVGSPPPRKRKFNAVGKKPAPAPELVKPVVRKRRAAVKKEVSNGTTS